jgi:hypothetical protein
MLKFWRRGSRRRVEEIQRHLKELGDRLRYTYTNFSYLTRRISEREMEKDYSSLLDDIIDADKLNKEYKGYYTEPLYNPMYERVTAFVSEIRDRYHNEFKKRRERK